MWAPRPRAAFGARTVECLARPRVQQRVLRHRPAAFFSGAAQTRVEARELKSAAKKESSDGPIEKDSEYDEAIAHAKEKQARTPWHRQGSNLPPVSRPRVASAMTKGKLLTTPSRLLKLIIPLTTLDKNNDRKDVEPLALLVHPQQPLSYLERLIQSELPNIRSSKGEEKIPAVHFKAQDSTQDEIQPKTKTDSEVAEDREGETDADRTAGEDSLGGGKIAGTGILNRKSRSEAAQLRGGHGEGGVESYSGHGHEGEAPPPEKENFVRWSSSTEIGDFIRDAARGKEFAVEIEGAEKEIRIGVPSFNDRTHYLRERLRRTATKIKGMAELKKECDDAAHRGAQRVALSGFGGVLGWWFAVYYLTFQTDLGWDFMEPVTYLVGLSGLMCGYLWFLYHNREVSYRSALNLTISRRQTKLYNNKGFNLDRWEDLIKEGNALRAEIKAVATEYDVEWDEKADEQHKSVTQALKKARQEEKENKSKDEDEDKEDDVDDEEEKGDASKK